eukprot:356387-Chlamydomonas_euryale.AAC.3
MASSIAVQWQATRTAFMRPHIWIEWGGTEWGRGLNLGGCSRHCTDADLAKGSIQGIAQTRALCKAVFRASNKELYRAAGRALHRGTLCTTQCSGHYTDANFVKRRRQEGQSTDGCYVKGNVQAVHRRHAGRCKERFSGQCTVQQTGQRTGQRTRRSTAGCRCGYFFLRESTSALPI